ncbi:CdaR family protein [Lacinutrix neustonica]|uniref:CdaR family protein n=1 Tax=Lacinutrix neustonica TaxID=2980107 RepID=A0A9E8SD56_9FLAO|nr:CdaR family protein [Lacinutrix neustonica]WAC02073.1 CdaR family protein [Lacinutrix neustonica]
MTIDFNTDVRKIDSVYIWSKTHGFAGVLNQFKKESKIVSITPDTLFFKFDVNAVKYVPVKSNINIHYSLGYDTLEGMKITPDSIKIIGPATLLSHIDAIETKVLKLDDVNKPFSETIDLRTDSINPKIIIKTKTVSIGALVEKFTEGTLNIPIEVIHVPRNKTLNYFPKSMNVSFYTSLNAFNTISVDDFKVVCDYKAINKDSKYLEPELVKIPGNVKTTRLHQQKIEFIIIE